MSTTIACSIRRRARTTRAGSHHRSDAGDGAAHCRLSQFRHVDELLFRRGEHFFVRRSIATLKLPMSRIIAMGPSSNTTSSALYKLGWALYKQDMYDEALHRYVALLDYKVSIGLRLRR